MTPSPTRRLPLLRGISYALLVVAGWFIGLWMDTIAAVLIVVGISFTAAAYQWWSNRRFVARIRTEAAEWNRKVTGEAPAPGRPAP